MPKKSFTSPPRRGTDSFDINGVVFRYNLDVPGAVIMDYMGQADEDNSSTMVEVVNRLLTETIVPEDISRFNDYIRNPENNVGIIMLTEICEFLLEEISGKDQPLSGFGAGS